MRIVDKIINKTCLVYHAALPLAALTAVLSAPPDGSLEEARTAVTREYPVVLPGGEVTAHLARHVVQDPTAGVAHVVRGLRELDFADSDMRVVTFEAEAGEAGEGLNLDLHVRHVTGDCVLWQRGWKTEEMAEAVMVVIPLTLV